MFMNREFSYGYYYYYYYLIWFFFFLNWEIQLEEKFHSGALGWLGLVFQPQFYLRRKAPGDAWYGRWYTMSLSLKWHLDHHKVAKDTKTK